MKTLILAAGAALALSYYNPGLTSALLGGPLDGFSWEVRVRPNSFFSFAKQDTLVFQKGRLTSVSRLLEGFEPARYQVTGPGGGAASLLDRIAPWKPAMPAYRTTEFQASLSHARDGTLHWQGRVEGDSIQGTVTWLRRDGRVKEFTFRGTRRSA